MRLVGVSFVVVLALGGCLITPEQKARDVCTALCECIETGPVQVEACVVNECLPDIPPVSDPCLDCVYSNSQSCPALFDDCLDLCVDPSTPLLGGP